jgi:group I intron endonuclease
VIHECNNFVRFFVVFKIHGQDGIVNAHFTTVGNLLSTTICACKNSQLRARCHDLNKLENVEVEKIYSIYRITNKINQMVYIGFTGQTPHRRWQGHQNDAFRRSHKFQNALRKYGIENFEFEVLYQSKLLYHTAQVMEPLFIEAYETYGVGVYNSAPGGFIPVITDETRMRMSASQKGRVVSDITKIKLSLSCKGKLGNKSFLGKRHTQAVKDKLRVDRIGIPRPVYVVEKMRAALTGRSLSDEHRDTLSRDWIITHPCGKIEQIRNMKTFCNLNGLNGSAMSQVALGNRSHHKGFRCTKLS